MLLPALPRLPVPPGPAKLVAKLPRLLLRPARHSPFMLQRLLLETILHNVFRQAIEEDDFDFLKDKCLMVNIRDIELCWYFSFTGHRLIIKRYAKADVTISGELHEFLLLASRQEDPDTLFFQRRLQIDGDTELGLEVKNMLDGIDLDSLPVPLRLMLARTIALLTRQN